MITISDGTNTFQISDDDIKMAETDCLSFYEWITNAAQEKVRRVKHRLVLVNTNLNPSKLSDTEKNDALVGVSLRSVKEKNAELEAKMKGGK